MYSRILRYFVLFAFISVCFSFSVYSGNSPKYKSGFKLNSTQRPGYRPPGQIKTHDNGTLATSASNLGIYGSPNGEDPSMQWPGKSDSHYLWAGSIWAAGVIDGEKRCTNWEYFDDLEWRPSENSTFEFGPGKSPEDHFVVYDDLEYSEGHQSLGIRVSERGLTWKIENYDDFIVYEYEIENIGNNYIQDFYVGWFFDFDICRSQEFETAMDDLVDFEGWDGDDSDSDELDIVDPLDLDTDGKTGYDEWGWPLGLAMNRDGQPTNPNFAANLIEPDGFFDEWQIIRDPKGPILRWQTNRNPAYAHAGEIALINGDTLRGYLIPRNASYMYDHDNLETPVPDIGERNSAIPTPGFAFVRLIYSDIIKETEVFPYQTTPEDTFMRPYSHQWWYWSTSPFFDYQRYDYMAATHEASVKLGKHYHFVPHPFEIQAPVFDYRILQSTGPFVTFRPGEKLRFVVAVGLGLGFQGMRENMDHALEAYYAGSQKSDPGHPSAPDFDASDGDIHWFLSSPPPAPDLKYSPLDAGVQLAWGNAAETAVDPILQKVNFVGYKIYRSVYNEKNWEMIAAFDNLNEPVLVKDSNGKILNPKKDVDTGEIVANGALAYDELPNFEYVKEDLPPIVNSFIDTGGVFLGRKFNRPLNGIKYYYSVVSYNAPRPPQAPFPALDSQESPKNNYMVDLDSGLPLPVIPTRFYNAEDVCQLDLNQVKVVPNPYKGTSLFESVWEDKIQFTNLPPVCKISIFTPTGELVDTVYHISGTNYEFWHLITRNQMRLVSGLYIFVVETERPAYAKSVGKFVVIR